MEKKRLLTIAHYCPCGVVDAARGSVYASCKKFCDGVRSKAHTIFPLYPVQTDIKTMEILSALCYNDANFQHAFQLAHRLESPRDVSTPVFSSISYHKRMALILSFWKPM
nr:hypothetical protein Iba_chr12eCG4640 [Ipomoea batatas]